MRRLLGAIGQWMAIATTALGATLVLDDGFRPAFTTTRGAALFSVALQPDGKILVGGDFLLARSELRPGLARLLASGELDPGFNAGAGVEGRVYAIVVQPEDGRILIGGRFSRVADQPYATLARLLPDGRLDASFRPAFGGVANPMVGAIALQPDGRIVVGGRFGSVDGVPRDGLVRLLPSGELDASFNPGTGLAGARAYEIAIDALGRIYLGGSFEQVGGEPRGGLARLNPDGSVDAGFAPALSRGGGAAAVYALALQPERGVLVAGDFDLVGETPRNGIARFDFSGQLDEGFDPGDGAVGGRGAIYDLVCAAEERVVVTGGFDGLGDQARSGIGALLADGKADPEFVAGGGLTPGGDAAGYMLALQPDGKVIVAGQFHAADGTPRHCLGRFQADGTLDAEFFGGDAFFEFPGSVRCTQVLPGGGLLVGGDFERVNGMRRDALVRLGAGGAPDAKFSAAFKPGAVVNALALQPDGRVVAGGAFEAVDGDEQVNLTRLEPDGTPDETFHGPELDEPVYALLPQPDGGLLFGGEFRLVDGERRFCLARATASGHLDERFQPLISSWMDAPAVYALAASDNGAVLVGGFFNEVDANRRSHLVRLSSEGVVDADYAAELELAGDAALVTCLVPQADGGVLLGGSFRAVNGEPATGIARLDARGRPDPGFLPGLGVGGGDYPGVEALARLADGAVLLGGEFTQCDTSAATNLALLAGNGGFNFVSTPRPAPDGVVFTLAQPAPDAVVVGGAFTRVSGQRRLGLARYRVLPDLRLRLVPDGGRVQLSWEGEAILEEAADPAGTWHAVAGATSPHVEDQTPVPRFFRLRRP